MKVTFAAALAIAMVCFAGVVSAQQGELALDAVPETAMMNATMNATATNATTTDANAASAPSTMPMEFPVFNYEAIFPSGVFSATAYGAWLGEVTRYYEAIASQWYPGEGVLMTEEAIAGSFGIPTFGTVGGIPSFGVPAFNVPNFGFQGPFAQAAQAYITG
mmetsp:Transcript_37262/g.80529  ORF Transcript_37262/g.80529 Transcript_37262/m.80529 type:complete len:162 (-) Transcript_37262:174-659(-)